MAINFVNNTRLINAEIQKAIQDSLNEIGIKGETQAKKNITENKNIDTGRLRASITYDIDINQKKVRIGTNVQYGVYLEKGTGLFAEDGNGRKTPWVYKDRKGNFYKTSGQKPSPFIEPAVNKLQSESSEIVAKHLKKVGK